MFYQLPQITKLLASSTLLKTIFELIPRSHRCVVAKTLIIPSARPVPLIAYRADSLAFTVFTSRSGSSQRRDKKHEALTSSALRRMSRETQNHAFKGGDVPCVI